MPRIDLTHKDFAGFKPSPSRHNPGFGFPYGMAKLDNRREILFDRHYMAVMLRVRALPVNVRTPVVETRADGLPAESGYRLYMIGEPLWWPSPTRLWQAYVYDDGDRWAWPASREARGSALERAANAMKLLQMFTRGARIAKTSSMFSAMRDDRHPASA